MHVFLVLGHISEKGNSQTFEIFAFICHVTTGFHKANMPVLIRKFGFQVFSCLLINKMTGNVNHLREQNS